MQDEIDEQDDTPAALDETPEFMLTDAQMELGNMLNARFEASGLPDNGDVRAWFWSTEDGQVIMQEALTLYDTFKTDLAAKKTTKARKTALTAFTSKVRKVGKKAGDEEGA